PRLAHPGRARAHRSRPPAPGGLAGRAPHRSRCRRARVVARRRPAARAPGSRPVTPTFVSLGNRNFRLFASGQLVSNTGTWMQRVAQDWLVLTLTAGSGTALGITTALQFLPVLLLSLWGGVVADRLPKRPVLIVTQSAAGLQALVLGVLVLSGHARIWQV